MSLEEARSRDAGRERRPRLAGRSIGENIEHCGREIERGQLLAAHRAPLERPREKDARFPMAAGDLPMPRVHRHERSIQGPARPVLRAHLIEDVRVSVDMRSVVDLLPAPRPEKDIFSLCILRVEENRDDLRAEAFVFDSFPLAPGLRDVDSPERVVSTELGSRILLTRSPFSRRS